MENQGAFNQILEAADRLSLEEKEALIAVLRKRLVDQRREELAREIQAARKEFAAGECQPFTPGDIIKAL